MWGKLWVLPLCTVIVAIFSAPFASGQCSCNGPTTSDRSLDDIDPVLCGPDVVDECTLAGSGEVCICNYNIDFDITNIPAVVLGADPIIEWWCVQDGNDGYCTQCTADAQCNTAIGEICCPETGLCSVGVAGACGDPHMTGFRGQKFDFVGQDGEWYSVVSDMPDLQVNMRVTSPVPAEPEITYITGLGIKTIDSEGLDHTIVITVTDPHSLDSACPMEGSPCLADGALTVELDGEVALLSPGEVNLGPNLAISAANLPGACRSFGFEKYWERKKAEYAANGRKLDTMSQMQMSDWILGDPTATNMAECTEYVLDATADGGAGLFEHESEHTSFQISTPKEVFASAMAASTKVATRDPTDRFDIPDHLTWQMNLAFDNVDLSPDATGILGETQQHTLDANGNPIMEGMSAIRGSQEDYLVEGPLDTVFAAAGNHP